MESIPTVLLGLGIVIAILSLLLGIIELATLRTISPPKQKTFAYIRLAASQYQTVVVPALGALISGVFVSLAASFFYASFTSEDGSGQQQAGVITFMAAGGALVVTLRSLIKDVGEPEQLARDPFTIRAAADESASNPRRGVLDPDLLTRQLCEWADYLSARSLNISVNKKIARLDQSLARSVRSSGFWTSTFHSFLVYISALRGFPFRFGWPLLGPVLILVGSLWLSVAYLDLDLTASWRPWATPGVFVSLGSVLTLFYCAARGNRARLWHRINLVAYHDARRAIDAAKTAHAAVAAEDALLQRVLARADTFFKKEQTAVAPEEGSRTVLRLGRFRVLIVASSPSNRRASSGTPPTAGSSAADPRLSGSFRDFT